MTGGASMMPESTRAARFVGPRHIELESVPMRPPGPGEVRVRLEGCGVCGSNLPVWEGRPWFRYPLAAGAPGHEGWGIVEALGEGVAELVVGDRVAFLSERAFTEHALARACDAVKLPLELAGRPFPGEPLGCAVNIFRRSEISAGQTVAVVGVGFIGAAVTALAARAGARVIALSRRPFALALAERLGADACVQLDEPARALRGALRIAGDSGCERVIEAVGSQEALDLASQLCGTRARLVIAGYHQDGTRRVNVGDWNWRGLDVINAHERDPAEYRRGMEEAASLAVAGALDLGLLCTHAVDIEELPRAFALLTERPLGFLKAWMACP